MQGNQGARPARNDYSTVRAMQPMVDRTEFEIMVISWAYD